jgi:hypothetical protein
MTGIFSDWCDEGRMMMRKVFRFFVFAVCLVSVSTGAGLSQVVINEFLADPARDWDGDGVYNYRDDEWIEISNVGSAAEDLDAYLIADGEENPLWRYGFSGLLEPGGVLVVYGSDSRAWEESNGFPIYGLSLNNGGDSIGLYRVSGADTILVDAFQYGDRAAEDDRSVGRDARAFGVWFIFDALNPCPDSCDPPGCGCIPTPGAANDCITGAGSESWGLIKNRYRG